jgi:hypothetical protein
VPRTIQFVVQPSPRSTKLQYGHYIAVGNSNVRRGDYYRRVNSSKPNMLTLTGVRGVQIRYKWGDLESAPGVYSFGTVKATYPDTERTIRADLWRCQQNNSRLIILVEDRTFDGTNPMPADMAGNTQYVQYVTTSGGTGAGYTAVRWNAYVQTRFQALSAALGAAFDSSPYWYALAFQETAIGMDGDQRAATGYTDTLYRDAIIANLEAASDAFPSSQIFWYTNYFPTPAQDYRLQEVADSIKNYNNGDHGVVMGGPDILPDSSSLVSRVYPRFGDPPTGSNGELDLFNSMQFDSYAHTHTTASTVSSPDPRMPGDTWTLGSLWTMDQLFRWARDDLNLNYVIWENDTAGTQTFIPHGRDVIAAYPTFNT